MQVSVNCEEFGSKAGWSSLGFRARGLGSTKGLGFQVWGVEDSTCGSSLKAQSLYIKRQMLNSAMSRSPSMSTTRRKQLWCC